VKRVVSGQEPAILTAFRAARPAGTWRQFKRRRGSTAVFDALAAAQGYLCAYCEIRIGQPAGCILDPRAIPAVPSIWKTSSRGELSVKMDACLEAGAEPDVAESTLEFLGLNRRVLVRLRDALLDELDQTLKGATNDDEVRQRILVVASARLVSDPGGRLSPFWSTIRAWAGAQGESIVAENASRIPGLT
jgi:hypothetical protein